MPRGAEECRRESEKVEAGLIIERLKRTMIRSIRIYNRKYIVVLQEVDREVSLRQLETNKEQGRNRFYFLLMSSFPESMQSLQLKTHQKLRRRNAHERYAFNVSNDTLKPEVILMIAHHCSSLLKYSE